MQAQGTRGRLADTFAAARKEGRSVLVGYLPAGYPTVDGGIAAMRAMVEAGVDVVEVGLPYSDPTIDGPVIQEAVDAALRGGVTTADVLRTVEAVAETGAPALVMTYWNPVERYGVERFAADLAAAGGAGTITPDLPPEEAGPWLAAAGARDLDSVFLVAPSSTDERIRMVTEITGGFVYAASLMGVTGARQSVGAAAEGLVKRVRAVTDLPVSVGLGVRDGGQAATVAAFADGVIVGSALVGALLAAERSGSGLSAGLDGIRTLTAELAAGVRRPA
ncbi:tryptophan synthase subunit alpha [Pseudofrankia sp. BMG5.37]|uniref:tryptophan synthase subunit alpha n=1 Tax=Pseudofrankia sp. BMG5.37 TaxID=3050035 RepID=UPI002895949B|nr:tryptophan synthase subunit alpha [Pseudofrankia sp. BMG5.37]MDT3438178.1 tryptophan synthase subunit alpha [Pseudofrankia sp. BMG5.37]